MKNKLGIKILSVISTILILFPVVFMVFTSIIGSISEQQFLFDYLMPAEWFFMVLIGIIFLFLVMYVQKYKLKQLIFSSLTMVLFLIAGILYADLSGLSSGTPGASNSETIVIIFFALYTLMVIFNGLYAISITKKVLS